MLVLTVSTHIEAPGAFPGFSVATPGADKTLWPSALKQILKTALFAGKAVVKLNLVLGKIFNHPRLLIVFGGQVSVAL
jgi:hypothetical protein